MELWHQVISRRSALKDRLQEKNPREDTGEKEGSRICSDRTGGSCWQTRLTVRVGPLCHMKLPRCDLTFKARRLRKEGIKLCFDFLRDLLRQLGSVGMQK